MAKPDGGPAFPDSVSADTLGGLNFSRHQGMTLRDYFAARALLAVMAARVALVNANLANDLTQESIAEECFELADAMLAERAK